MVIFRPMKLIKFPTRYLAAALGLGLTLGVVKAQTSFDISNQSSDLDLATSWTPPESDGSTPPPEGDNGAVWDSNSVTTASSVPLIDSFTSSTGTLGSISLNKWNSTVMINSNGSTDTNSSAVTLIGNPSISTTAVGLDIGNLNIDPSSSGGSTFNLDNQLTITGALGTAQGSNTTVTVNDGGPLNLIGSSNAGSVAGTSGQVNLNFQNHSNVTLGNNTNKTFGELTINGNTSLTQDNVSAVSANNLNNESAFALTAKSQATFTGGLNITSGNTLTIYGWQGVALGGTSSDEQLLFNPVDATTGLTNVLGVELTNVLFDLTTNEAGPTTSPYDPSAGAQYDYGEWIVDPNNSSLDELVPYAAVPEPASVFGALALLGLLVYRERRRFAFLDGFLNQA